jgi:hypothetical protein
MLRNDQVSESFSEKATNLVYAKRYYSIDIKCKKKVLMAWIRARVMLSSSKRFQMFEKIATAQWLHDFQPR